MITHDICQPWEVELAKLKKQLEEAEKALYRVRLIHDEECDIRAGETIEHCTCYVKLHYEYQQKYGEKK